MVCCGQTATHAAVFARLVLNGEDKGIHAFMARVRDPDTHEPVPGVLIGDVGPKLGCVIFAPPRCAACSLACPLATLTRRVCMCVCVCVCTTAPSPSPPSLLIRGGRSGSFNAVGAFSKCDTVGVSPVADAHVRVYSQTTALCS